MADTGLPTLASSRGDDYPALDAETSIKVKYVDKMWSTGEQEALAAYRQATHNILYANNRHWIDWNKVRRQWEDIPTVDFRMTVNYIGVLLRARVQRLTSSEVNWRVTPESNSMEASDRAKVAVNFLKHRWSASDMDHKGRLSASQSALTGLVAFKSFWNPQIGPLTAATAQVQKPITLPAMPQGPTVPPGSAAPGQNPDASQEPAEGGAGDEGAAEGPGSPQAGQGVAPLAPPLPDLPPMQTMSWVTVPVDANGDEVESEEDAFHFRPGDTDTAIRTVFNLRMNQEAYGWTESEGFRWLVDRDLVPIAVAKERFPLIADKVKPLGTAEAGLNYERIIQGSAVQRQTPYITQSQSTDVGENTAISEYWEGKSLFFPKGRLIVVVGGAVAYDGEWPDGIFPYAPVFGEPGVMSWRGRAPVNDWISPQNVINREITAIAKEQWSSGTGKFVSWDVPGVPEQLSKDDDQIVKIPMRPMLSNKGIHDIFGRIPPAQASPDRWRLIEQSKQMLFDIGAYHEVSRGQIPPGLDSGVAIQYLLEQESAQLKDTVESLKRSYILWGKHQLAIAKRKYGTDMTRWMPVDRPDLGYQLETVNGVVLPDPETLQLDIEYFRPQSEAGTRAEVKDLLAMQMIDPRKAMQIMDLGVGFEQAYASQTRHYAKARWENEAIQKGEFTLEFAGQNPQTGEVIQEMVNLDGSPMLMPQDDDVQIHLDVHQEISLDPKQPWSVRQMVMQHMDEHRTAVKLLAAQQVSDTQSIAAVGGQDPSLGPPPSAEGPAPSGGAGGNPYKKPNPPPASQAGQVSPHSNEK